MAGLCTAVRRSGFKRTCIVCTGFLVLAFIGCAWKTAPSHSDPILAAVAANFTGVQLELAGAFTRRTGIPVESTFGSTGALYSQVKNGAPFDVFLAADAKRPDTLESEGLAVAGTRFTYAIGTLVVYAPTIPHNNSLESVLRDAGVKHVAICKPELAPYGTAAQQTLEHLGLWEEVQSKLVQGDNVTQAFQYVESGNAELGFVAYSQVLDKPRDVLLPVPEEYHEPINQDAVLLRHGAANNGAKAFLDFLRGPEAAELIRAAGYSVPSPAP